VPSLLRRAAGRVALDEEDLALAGVPLLAVGELPGEGRGVEGALAPRELARLPRGLAGAGRVDALEDDRLGDGGVLLEKRRELVVDQRLDLPAHLRVPELGLRLPLELGLRDLDRDHRGEAFAHVLPLKLEVL